MSREENNLEDNASLGDGITVGTYNVVCQRAV